MEDPLERELRDGTMHALRSVPEVTELDEDDREVWLVSGRPAREQLVRAAAAAAAVDALAERARVYTGF